MEQLKWNAPSTLIKTNEGWQALPEPIVHNVATAHKAATLAATPQPIAQPRRRMVTMPRRMVTAEDSEDAHV